MSFADAVKFNRDGLVPVIAQDVQSGDVLMLAYMNREALEITVQEQKACYWSRSRKKLWRKGETSGNVQEVVSIHLDCDGDTILLKVNQIGGAACHTGYATCFYQRWNGAGFTVEGERVFDPEKTYR